LIQKKKVKEPAFELIFVGEQKFIISNYTLIIKIIQ